MENITITAIMVCKDGDAAQRSVRQLQSSGIQAAAVGNVIQATKESQVVGELPNTAPKEDRNQALIKTLMGEIEAEEQLREALNMLGAPYIIFDDVQIDRKFAEQAPCFSYGVSGAVAGFH